MINGPILLKKFGRAIASVVRVRETKVDQEWLVVLGRFSFSKIVEHLLCMPCTAGFLCSAALAGVATDRELHIGRFVAISKLACSHR